MQIRKLALASMLASSFLLMACSTDPRTTATQAAAQQSTVAYQFTEFATFQEPWAMTQLPDGTLLITERKGQLQWFNPVNKQTKTITGIPKVAYGGQGGLGDVQLHPDFANNHLIYLSYAEAENNQYGATVVRAKLDLSVEQPKLENIQRIWTQVPKLSGQGHYSYRILFDQAGKFWISSGERQAFDPAQDMQSNLGKVIRLNDDGGIPQDNPFIAQGGIAQQIWSLGHRNPLGMAFDHKGQLWVIEMGPKGGDELNLVKKAANYGYPIVSNGDHYDGKPIPNHDTRPEFEAPALDWTPVISPSSLLFYRGEQFPAWQNKAIATGLSSKAVVIIDTEAQPVKEVARIEMGERIRAAMQDRDGSIWVLQDGPNAKLLKLTP